MAAESTATEVDDIFEGKAEDEAEFRYLLIRAIARELVTNHLPLATVRGVLGAVEAEAVMGFPKDGRKDIDIFAIVKGLFDMESGVLRARHAG